MSLRLRLPKLTPDVKRLVSLGIPGIVAGGITQVNILIATMIATGIDRAVSYLYYADRVYQLPLGVIGVAIGVVLLPEMARKLRSGDEAGAIANQNRALEFALFLTLPATVALIALPLADRQYLLRTRRVHEKRHAGDRQRSCRLRDRPAGLHHEQDFLARLFRARGHRRPMMFAITSVAINVTGSLVLSQFIGLLRHRAVDRDRGLGQRHHCSA